MFDIAIIEKKIGYEFEDKSLLQLAFTHNSFSEYNYQRLEFLGDSILSIIVADYLYQNYPNYDEGKLTLIRQNIVDKPPLKKAINKLDIQQYIFLGKGEKASHLEKTEKLCGDLYESILGAIFVDAKNSKNNINNKYIAYSYARDFVMLTLKDTIDNVAKHPDELIDFKSKIIQFCQKHRFDYDFGEPIKEGEDHNPIFTVNLIIDGEKIATSKGTSIKSAEQAASRIALGKFNLI